jgi:hypothetical protein
MEEPQVKQLLQQNKGAKALISLGQIRRLGIDGVFCLQLLIDLDPRGLGAGAGCSALIHSTRIL